MLVFLLLMETVEDKVVVVQEYQQLLALMVFLVEVLDITLVVEAEVVTVVVDYQLLLEEKAVVELVAQLLELLVSLEQQIQAVEVAVVHILNQVTTMVEMEDLV